MVRYGDWYDVDAAAIYTLLGVREEEWLQLMVQLQVWWQNGALCVASAFERRNDLPELPTGVLLKVWDFAEWSDSRWLGLARSSWTLALVIAMRVARPCQVHHRAAQGFDLLHLWFRVPLLSTSAVHDGHRICVWWVGGHGVAHYAGGQPDTAAHRRLRRPCTTASTKRCVCRLVCGGRASVSSGILELDESGAARSNSFSNTLSQGRYGLGG